MVHFTEQNGKVAQTAKIYVSLELQMRLQPNFTQLYIDFRKRNIFQEIQRPEILHLVIYRPELKLHFWSAKWSENIFCDPKNNF